MSSRRGSARHLPDGLYSVPDPDDRARLTFWSVRSGTLRDWPVGTRWRPVRPPYPVGLSLEQRRAWSDEWYSDVYFVWKDRLVEAIAVDLEGAAERFRRRHPGVELPPVPARPVRVVDRRTRVAVPRPRETAFQARLFEQRVIAAALRRGGKSYAAIGQALGVSKPTAVRWVREGEALGKPTTQDLVVGALYRIRIGALEDRLRQVCAGAGSDDRVRVEEMAAQLRALRAAVPTVVRGLV